MNAPLDDITAFMGTLPPEEYELRRRIRVARNAASFKLRRTDSDNARALCWQVAETATAWLYAPADLEALTEVAKLLRRLLTVADQFEIVEAML